MILWNAFILKCTWLCCIPCMQYTLIHWTAISWTIIYTAVCFSVAPRISFLFWDSFYAYQHWKHLNLLSGLNPIPSAMRKQSTGSSWVNMQIGAQGEFQLFHILHSGMTTDMKPQPVLHSSKPSPGLISASVFFLITWYICTTTIIK